MSYLTLSTDWETVLIPYTTHTLREEPSRTFRRQPLEGDTPPEPYDGGTEIIGCVLTRITPKTAPFLFSLIMEEITGDAHRPGTRDLRDITRKRKQWTTPITVAEITEEERTIYENLSLIGYSLSAYRQSAFTLRLDFSGTEKTILPLIQPTPVFPSERFSYLNTPPRLNDAALDTLAYFSLTGEKTETGEIQETLLMRQKGYPAHLTGDNTFSLTVEGDRPWSVNIPRAVSRHIITFDTEKERWGWESTCQVWGGTETTTSEKEGE